MIPVKKSVPALFLTLVMFSLFSPAALGAGNGSPRLNANYNWTTYIDDSGSVWDFGYEDGLPHRVVEGEGCTAQASSGVPSMLVRTDGTLLFFSEGFSGEGIEWMTGAVKAEYDYLADCGYVLTGDGALYGWGSNHSGTLSPGGVPIDGETLQMVPLFDEVADFLADSSTVFALRKDGSLWAWGDDAFSVLGNGRESPDSGWLDVYREEPVWVLDKVTKMALGNINALAVREDGTLWAWGIADGLLFEEHYDKVDCFDQGYCSRPAQVMEGVRDVAAANTTSYIIKEDNSLWVCGSNIFGEAGTGGEDYVPLPTQIMADVDEVTAGEFFAIARKIDSSLWVWGLNDRGQLGNGFAGTVSDDRTSPYQPLPVQLFTIPPNAAPDMAYASSQAVLVDGSAVQFPCYALKDENGNDTNYIKLRDLAIILNGTAAQFEVEWDGSISLAPGKRYSPNGSELSGSRSGMAYYTVQTDPVKVNGQEVVLDSFVITDTHGGGSTYFRLRDLGAALGFTVDWSAETGIYIQTQ